MQYATKRLIDSVWTMGYEIQDNMVVIHSYDRENPVGYKQERELPQVSLIENDARLVTSVFINDKNDPFRLDHSKGGEEYTVANPKHVFSYNLDTPPEITVKPVDPTESTLYLNKVKVAGVSTSSTPYKTSVDNIEGNMRSALFDAIYTSLKQKNIMDADQLTNFARKAVESLELKIRSSEVKETAKGVEAHLQRITVEITQNPKSETPVLTEDVLDATNEFKANHPKPWQSFEALDAKPPAPNSVIEEVRSAQSVQKELTAKLDPKYTVDVSEQPYEAFLVEIKSEYGLVERLPSYQPNFEDLYARMLVDLAPPKPSVENEREAPRFSR